MSQRDTSRTRMESRIEEAEGYLKILRARAKRASAEAREEVEERIRDLQSWTRSARERMQRAEKKTSSIGKDAWDELEGRWDRVRGAVDAVLARLNRDPDG